ncbi:MAG: hypothetical protein EBQ92_06425 [Proteobacteria bacterium]|nr:hypothetical protein [Pseudomonadota bacterium]
MIRTLIIAICLFEKVLFAFSTFPKGCDDSVQGTFAKMTQENYENIVKEDLVSNDSRGVGKRMFFFPSFFLPKL